MYVCMCVCIHVHLYAWIHVPTYLPTYLILALSEVILNDNIPVGIIDVQAAVRLADFQRAPVHNVREDRQAGPVGIAADGPGR